MEVIVATVMAVCRHQEISRSHMKKKKKHKHHKTQVLHPIHYYHGTIIKYLINRMIDIEIDRNKMRRSPEVSKHKSLLFHTTILWPILQINSVLVKDLNSLIVISY
jgi:hypothetical protein